MLERFERFSVIISEISRHWHKIAAAEMEKRGLKGAHSIYLITMSRYPDGISASQICELCCKDKADVSRTMRAMEEKGLVIKEGGHQNRYNGVYRLTGEGLAAAEYVKQRASLAVELSGSSLTEASRSILYNSLEIIAENMKNISENGLTEEI